MLHIGVLQFSIAIPHATSLKEKRSVIKSLKDRLRRSFNISVSEIDDLDDVTTGTLAAVLGGNEVAHVNSSLDHLLNTLQDLRDATLTDHQLEIFSPR
jgi:uncharacterized protein YlxP (DUF503 family)